MSEPNSLQLGGSAHLRWSLWQSANFRCSPAASHESIRFSFAEPYSPSIWSILTPLFRAYFKGPQGLGSFNAVVGDVAYVRPLNNCVLPL